MPNIDSLLDGSSDVVRLSTHNGENVHRDMMACGVGMVINRRCHICKLSRNKKPTVRQ